MTTTCFDVNTPSSGSLVVVLIPNSGSCLLHTTHTTHHTHHTHHTPHTTHHTHTHTHTQTTQTHTHTPNQELHMQPQLPTFYHNNTLLYCILSF